MSPAVAALLRLARAVGGKRYAALEAYLADAPPAVAVDLARLERDVDATLADLRRRIHQPWRR